MNADTRVCERCLEAAGEEGLIDGRESVPFCIEYGDELADHLCDEIETSGMTGCNCACHPTEKERLRHAATKAGA